MSYGYFYTVNYYAQWKYLGVTLYSKTQQNHFTMFVIRNTKFGSFYLLMLSKQGAGGFPGQHKAKHSWWIILEVWSRTRFRSARLLLALLCHHLPVCKTSVYADLMVLVVKSLTVFCLLCSSQGEPAPTVTLQVAMGFKALLVQKLTQFELSACS